MCAKRSAENMTLKEIVDVQLDSFFGAGLPRKIQRLVDEELNRGRWVEGYDIAVSVEPLGVLEAERLLEVVLKQNEQLRINRNDLLQTVEDELPQSMGAKVLWIVDEDGSFALTDSLRVARFAAERIVWCSPRISFDGIEFCSLEDGRLKGKAWWLGSHESPDSPFCFDFDSGELLEGQVVPE